MESAGLEPAISGLQDQRLANLATTPKLSNNSDRSGGDRTHDLWFVRPALPPLSYAPKNLWLGDVDSNHDQQSQNLLSCQLDDLPIFKSRRWESNPHPAAYETAAASFELRRRVQKRAVGIEPTTSSLEDWRASGSASLARAATRNDETVAAQSRASVQDVVPPAFAAKIGVAGFEPATSRARAVRSAQAELHSEIGWESGIRTHAWLA